MRCRHASHLRTANSCSQVRRCDARHVGTTLGRPQPETVSHWLAWRSRQFCHPIGLSLSASTSGPPRKATAYSQPRNDIDPAVSVATGRRYPRRSRTPRERTRCALSGVRRPASSGRVGRPAGALDGRGRVPIRRSARESPHSRLGRALADASVVAWYVLLLTAPIRLMALHRVRRPPVGGWVALLVATHGEL